MPSEYAAAQKWLHWLVALGAVVAIGLGVAMVNVGPGRLKDALGFGHKSTGALVLGLMILRIGARLFWRAPPPPPNQPRAQARAAFGVHLALYALLIGAPLLGWAAASAYPAPRPVFGLFELPAILPPHRPTAEMLFDLHGLAGLSIAMVASIHVIAAFWHLYALRDGVFGRMWFRFTDRD